jgi:hypothetical protein
MLWLLPLLFLFVIPEGGLLLLLSLYLSQSVAAPSIREKSQVFCLSSPTRPKPHPQKRQNPHQSSDFPSRKKSIKLGS